MGFQLSEIEDVSGEMAIEIATSRERKHENYREFSYEFPYYSSLFPSYISHFPMERSEEHTSELQSLV